jgi:hypothetical protein
MDLKGKDVHFEEFPKVGRDYKPKFKTQELVELNRAIWKAKKDKGISLKKEVRELSMPEAFKGVEKDLQEMHNIKHVSYGKKIIIKI